MKITGVKCDVLHTPVDPPWRHGTATMTDMYAVLVRVETDAGITGMGEGLARLGAGGTKGLVDEVLAPVVMGRDPFDVEAIWDDMLATMRGRGHSRGYLLEAISGVDIALWDIVGKALKAPVHQALMGYHRKTLPCYASSILIKDPMEMVNEARALVEEGYNSIKVKIGRGVKEDVAVMRSIREAVGNDITLTADCNCRYDTASAILLAKRLEELDLYWLEEPLPSDNLPGYKRLRSQTTLRIAAGEAEFTPFGVRDLIENAGIDVIQPDVARAGGFTGCRRMAYLAYAHDIAYAPHTGASSAVCIAASLQVGASVPNFLVFENMFIGQPLQGIFTEKLPQAKNGMIEVPQGPGLGFELDEEVLAKFIVS